MSKKKKFKDQVEYRKAYSRKLETRYKQQLCLTKSRNTEWSIGFEEFTMLQLSNCSYCGGPLGETGSSLDRIDPSKGYHSNNVLPCCPICNYVRVSMFTPSEMCLIGQVIARIREERKAKGKEPLTCVTSRANFKKKKKVS